MTSSLLRSALLPNGPKKGKIYIRVSDVAGRGELVSPEIQEMKAREEAHREGIEIIDVVTELDLSGRKFDKRKINQMIEEVRLGEYEYVILWKWSRFGRNLKESLIHLDELKAAGGKAVSATEPGDGETMMGKFSRNQMLLIAELQSDMIGAGWREAQDLRLLKGLPPTGKVGWGYHMVQQEIDGATFKIPAPHPVNGPALAEVYERHVVEGEYLSRIMLDMMSRGFRTMNNQVITQAGWLQYMDTGMAAGLIRIRKPGIKTRRFCDFEWVPGVHEAIIEMDVWEAYKQRRMANLGKNWSTGKAKYAFSGLLVCGRCKRRTVVAAGRQPRSGHDIRFACKGQKTKECKGIAVLSNVIEREVLKWLRERAHLITTDEEAARRLARDHQVTDEAAQLEKTIASLEKKLSRLLDLFEDGDLDKSEYKERRDEREAELLRAEARLSEIRKKTSQNLPASFYLNLEQAWGSLTHDRRRQGLQKVIDFIVVYPKSREGGRFLIAPYEKLPADKMAS